eukprot:CAMPEP_0114570736 /NCGR_PEP_ID=MMETSP0114-20121206/17365_1 /TAXON_ID=31324 /ORGANISM="Goniomonas sp, Strain m" /LENGTH=52 /DNA_ID=CAMNT_0001757795 /DNA_START=379 /DNA_END=538 /DNA_ORIENTATION=+
MMQMIQLGTGWVALTHWGVVVVTALAAPCLLSSRRKFHLVVVVERERRGMEV